MRTYSREFLGFQPENGTRTQLSGQARSIGPRGGHEKGVINFATSSSQSLRPSLVDRITKTFQRVIACDVDVWDEKVHHQLVSIEVQRY